MAKIMRTVFALLCALALPAMAGATVDVEVPIDAAFIPPQGYDDNDKNVVLVLQGYLPSACYELGATRIERDEAGRPVRVHQFAVQKIDGVCSLEASLPVELNQLIPFTKEVSLGRLEAGEYSIAYLNKADESGWRSRSFNVAVAPVASIDNLSYPSVGNATITEVMTTADSARVTITGILTSSCVDVAESVTIERFGDVIVLLPTVRSLGDGIVCTQVLRAFSRTIDLGRLARGTYLLHVRSQNGVGINRVFHVEQTL